MIVSVPVLNSALHASQPLNNSHKISSSWTSNDEPATLFMLGMKTELPHMITKVPYAVITIMQDLVSLRLHISIFLVRWRREKLQSGKHGTEATTHFFHLDQFFGSVKSFEPSKDTRVSIRSSAGSCKSFRGRGESSEMVPSSARVSWDCDHTVSMSE